MVSRIYGCSLRLRDTRGLDPHRYQVGVGVHRRNAEELTRADLARITAAFAEECLPYEPRPGEEGLGAHLSAAPRAAAREAADSRMTALVKGLGLDPAEVVGLALDCLEAALAADSEAMRAQVEAIRAQRPQPRPRKTAQQRAEEATTKLQRR